MDSDAGVYHGSVAHTWDSMQGEFGDAYRRETIHPFISSLLDALGARAFIDLGSGNGCTLRYMERFGVDRLVGVEASPELVELARGYGGPKSRSAYVCGDMSSVSVLARSAVLCQGSGPILAASLFGVQDCSDLGGFFASLRAILTPADSLLLVFEDPAGMLAGDHKYALRSGAHVTSDGRTVQFVEWLGSGVHYGRGEGGVRNRIVTHLRTVEEYVSAAVDAGFKLRDCPIPHPASSKFNFLFFSVWPAPSGPAS